MRTPECKIVYAGLTDPGRVRERNEDRWLADEQLGLFAVSDGMGGESAGELAAEIVIKSLPSVLHTDLRGISNWQDPRNAERVLAGLSDLSRQLRRDSMGQPGLDGMGATIVLAVFRGWQMLIAHMGDSRAYVMRGDRVELVTSDHSIVQLLLDLGEITPDEAIHHPARSQLTRFVGMSEEPLPESKVVDLRPGDRLLLCSDGLTGMVSDEEIRTILIEHPSPKVACERLISTANAAGGRDNITAVLVTIGHETH